MTELERKLGKLSRRLSFLEGLSAAIVCLFYGLVAATGIVILHKLVDLGMFYGIAVAVAVAVAAPYGVARAVMSRGDLLDAAMAADERLGLKDRAASALTVAGSRSPMAPLLENDAERAAQLLDPVKHFPFRAPNKSKWVPVSLASMMIAAAFFPEFDGLGRREKKAAAEEERARIEQQAKNLKKRTKEFRERENRKLSKNEKKLLMEIEKVAAELGRTKKKRQAMMKLSETAEKLKQERKKYEGLKRTASRMKSFVDSQVEKGSKISDEARELARQLAAKDYKAAGKAMRELKKKMEQLKKDAAAGKITDEEMKAAQRELEKLAEAAAAMEKLQRALQRLSEALSKTGEFSEYDQVQFDEAMSELGEYEELTLEEIERLADLAERGELEIQRMKLQLSQLGEKCDQCGKRGCPCCGKPKCACSGEEQCSCKPGDCSGGMCMGGGAGMGLGAGAGLGQGQGRGPGQGMGDGTGGRGSGKGGDPGEEKDDTAVNPTLSRSKLGPGKVLIRGWKRGVPPKGQGRRDYAAIAAENKDAWDNPAELEKVPNEYRDMVRDYYDSVGVRKTEGGGD